MTQLLWLPLPQTREGLGGEISMEKGLRESSGVEKLEEETKEDESPLPVENSLPWTPSRSGCCCILANSITVSIHLGKHEICYIVNSSFVFEKMKLEFDSENIFYKIKETVFK